jgi:hypothetical protein
MPDITFTNGARIFTPSKPPQLGDVNNDGIIDILDAGDVNAFQLTDLNGDGVIDILDASEFLANGPGGIEIISVPNPEPPKEPVFDVARCCDENYPDNHWGFSPKYSNRQNSRKCVELKDQITKISTCLPCNSTPLEEAVCKACATIPPDGGFFGARLVEIYSAGSEPSGPGVRLGKGKASVTQDGVTYVVWCSMIAFRQCVECIPNPDNPSCCSIAGECECGLGPFGDPSWHAIGTNYCTGFTEGECLYYWFRLDYPYPTLSTPESYNGPYVGTFLWEPFDYVNMCKCADLTQDYDPCRYGGTIQQCIEENGGSIDPGPGV